MAREAKPCPFYGMPCEYVPMAEKADAAAARIEQLEAALRSLLEASERHIFSTECQAERDTARAALGEGKS